MPRVILYDRPALRDAEQRDGSPRYAGGGKGAPGAEEVRAGDDYVQRLVKYIPAEAIGFVIFGTSFPNEKDGHVVAVVVVAAVGQLLWLFRRGQQVPQADRPTARFYVLALIAFAAWALGTSPPVSELVGLDRTTAALILCSVAYLLPWIDPQTHAWLDPKPPEPERLRR